MFAQLTDRLSGIFNQLRGRGALTEQDVTTALREVRLALLEASVALPVAKSFIEEVKEKAIGQEVLQSITPGQMVIKIVHDHLISLLDHPLIPLNLAAVPPVVILMVGLQGSGKTTMTAKLGLWLMKHKNKKPLMASLDIYRPAAQEQLEILGKQTHIHTLPILKGQQPVDITKRALSTARQEGYDVLILDTAGRLHIDETLMSELDDVKKVASPHETLLVADSMTGQDALKMASAFHERLGLTGITFSRVDGDARGGALLSVRAVTGQPIKFLGVGEKPDQCEVFHPSRIADRLLGMGDIISLVEKAASSLNQEEMEKMASRMQQGQFTLYDMAKYIQQITKLGGVSGLLGALPGMGKFKEKIDTNAQEKSIQRQLAILASMTREEKNNPKILNASRKRRIAQGSGTLVPEINRLLKQYEDMKTVMKQMGKMTGLKGMMGRGLSKLFLR